MLNIYSSVQDHYQRFIYKRFCLNKLKSKGNFRLKLEEHLNESAPEKSESECV